jgi:hypothetical protein
VAGIDGYIGDSDYVHWGPGGVIIGRFLREIVFTDDRFDTRMIDPESENAVAIRAYEKVGFRYLRTVFIPGRIELAYQMVVGKGTLATPNGNRKSVCSNT